MSQSRQLLAIMFTDIEGYSAIMQRDEAKAIMLKDRHRTIVEAEHNTFNGNIIHYYGDGTLSTFASAVDAVECAIRIQKIFQQSPHVPVRIGLHIGDIIINDGNIFGDGVNLASRIESLGVVGSVLISDRVNDELRNHPAFQTLSMGIYNLKNIEREVEVFALDHEGLVKPVRNSLKGKTGEKKVTPLESSRSEKSIAVLPFVNMSNDPEQEYFSDGISEEILNSLAHLKNLKVAGRTSSFQFKGTNIDLRDLGKKLGVNTVLEGSVRKYKNLLRITVQLINTADGFHLWSERYDREIEDIFAIQDEIALSVTEKLKITLLDTEITAITNNPTENKEAYDLYLKGRFYWNRRGPGLEKALEYFQQAAQLDPEFFLAHAGIADAYTLIAFYSGMPPHKVIPLARQAAEKAMQLNPARVEPYSALAYITTFYDWDWAKSKVLFSKALAINPSYTALHYWHSNYLSWVTRDHLLAIKQAFRAIELEPMMSHSHSTLSSAYICYGKHQEALISGQTAVELDDNSFLGYCAVCMALNRLGRNDEAIETIKKGVTVSARHQYALHLLGWLYGVIDNIVEAQKILDELILRSKTEFISGVSLSVAAYYSRNYDQSFAFLEEAFEQRVGLLISMSSWPFLDYIRTDERFQPFLRRMNFPS